MLVPGDFYLTSALFYTQETLNWIQNHFGFTGLTTEGRLIIFEK
jgi:hypothetical protein